MGIRYDIDSENVKKQALLNLMKDMSLQTLQIAFVYAENYKEYGEDVTKTWNTATEQSSILAKAYRKGYHDALQKQAEGKAEEKTYETIKALEQELYDDAISRQAVINLCERFDGCVPYSVLSNYDMLPPVNPQPQPKTGQWIKKEIIMERDFNTVKTYRDVCSNCGIINISKYKNYCPNCGRKMKEIK